MNALSLPPALRFNAPVVPDALAQLARALESHDAPARVEDLAHLGNLGRLRDYGIPEDELPAVAEDVVARAGAKANPRPVTAQQAEELLRSIW
jgi:alcohol dehydrogenase class IV